MASPANCHFNRHNYCDKTNKSKKLRDSAKTFLISITALSVYSRNGPKSNPWSWFAFNPRSSLSGEFLPRLRSKILPVVPHGRENAALPLFVEDPTPGRGDRHRTRAPRVPHGFPVSPRSPAYARSMRRSQTTAHPRFPLRPSPGRPSASRGGCGSTAGSPRVESDPTRSVVISPAMAWQLCTL